MDTARRSLGRRLLRLAAWFVAAWLLLSFTAVLALRWLDPPTSAFMLGSRINAFFADDKRYTVRYQWVDYSQISRNAALAVIAAEDQRFADHWGFDFKSIDDSIRDSRRGKRLRGASTISQQVAKNLFLWKSPSFVRKGLEAWFTVLIELLWPKQRIVEMHLNLAEFGRGIYGVDAASRQYFRKRASRLTAAESALLAAVLPNPIRLKVGAPSRYVRGRQNQILLQMRALGGTSYLADYEQARKR